MDAQSGHTADSSLIDLDDLQQLHAGPLDGVEDLGSRAKSVHLLRKYSLDPSASFSSFWGEGQGGESN